MANFGPATFRSFKNPVFRTFFLSMLGQMAGMNMQMLARSLLIYRLTGSATILGIMSLANALPMFFASLFGGVIADRLQKKSVVLGGQIGSSLVSLGIALSLTFGYLDADKPGSWWILVVASLFQGTIMGLMMPSRQAIIREIVPQNDLMNAVGLNSLGMNSLRLIAPAVAGFLIEYYGFPAVYYTMTAMYFMASIFILPLPNTSTIKLQKEDAITALRNGFKYVRQEPTIMLVLIITLFTVLCSMPYMMLLPIFTEDVLKVGASGIGILMSVSGIGAMIGSLTIASLPDRKRGLLFVGTSLILGIALAGFSFSVFWYLSLILIFFVGIGQSGRQAVGNTLLQYYSAPEYRGRVMSFMMMEFGLTSFAVFFAAVVADIVGVQWSVGGLALLLVFLAIGVIIFSPRIRNLN